MKKKDAVVMQNIERFDKIVGETSTSRGDLESARYIADMTQELVPLAQAHKLEFLAYLLDLARLEAEAEVKRIGETA